MFQAVGRFVNFIKSQKSTHLRKTGADRHFTQLQFFRGALESQTVTSQKSLEDVYLQGDQISWLHIALIKQ